MPLLVAVVLIVLAAAAVTTWALTRSSATPPAAATAPRSASPECVAITRAYQAWDTLTLPRSVDGFQLESTEVSLSILTEVGKTLLDNVGGYDDQASKVLASAVAMYNAEVSMAKVQFTLIGEIERDQAVAVMEALERVRMDYLAWRTATCL